MRFGFYISSRRGNSTVDYLMITAVVAGVAVPIVMNYFGDPLINALKNQRQSLVQFVAQNPRNRRPNVPNTWFSIERQGTTGGEKELSAPSDLPPVGDINEPQPKDVGNIRTANLKNVKAIRPVGKITVPGGKDVGELNSVGNIKQGGGGGGGSGFDSGNGFNDSFFDKGGGGGKGGPGAPQDSGGGRSTYGRSSGGGETESSGGARRGGGEEARSKKEEAKGEEKGEDGGLDIKGKRDSLIASAQAEERERTSKFDWWFLIKIMIVFLIIFLIVLIALSNLKRR